MMSPPFGALIVFGSGPGVGQHVAALFAERGFAKVILMSRDATRLAKEAETIRSIRAGIDVRDIAVDFSEPKMLEQVLRDVENNLQDTPLECVLYNAARTGRSDFFAFTPENLENDLKVAIVSLYTAARWAMPHMLNAATVTGRSPALLVTSGLLAKTPYPAMFSLAACKSGQYSLVHSLHKEFEPKGVHCGLVVIGGTVSDDSEVTNARNIAEETWKMFSEPKGLGKLEIVMQDPDYSNHVRHRER